ncbi:hypothetical protein VPNG_06375 [Cytospora leucostoma]|uniref:Methyltransferase type 11 domain-containing protein n=1 Tax=Cytospora leucostoma TaxID=1230097 RepID=A0A423WYZ9_9PEZI|nr:hypothetical protein VPNG_06375 [Cytospora leucostoma]
MTIEEDRALSNPDYWDGRYAGGDGHEWFRSYDDLEPFLRPSLFEAFGPASEPLVLHLGSGDSIIPAELATRGYTRQLCVDFSPVVVELMSERHSSIPGIEWKQADVRNLDHLTDGSVNVAFDKGTLDAMIYGSGWNPPDEVRDNTSKYMREVHRVLKDDGAFLYITFRPPHFIRPLLNPADSLWELEMQTLESDKGTFPYYGYVLRKKSDTIHV